MQDFLAFRRMITPILIQIVYWLVTVVVVLIGLAGLFGGNGVEKLVGLLIVIVGPLLVRIYAEVIILGFKINETLTEIKNNTAPSGATQPNSPDDGPSNVGIGP